MATTVAMTNYSAQKTLHFWLNGGGTAVTQAAARPYIYLFTGTPTDDSGTGYTALSGGVTYTPQQLPLMNVAVPSSGTDFQRAWNNAAISFTMGGTGTSTANGILICLNNSAIPSLTNSNSQNDFLYYTSLIVNPVLYYGTFSSGISLNPGDTLTFSTGANTALSGIAIDQY